MYLIFMSVPVRPNYENNIWNFNIKFMPDRRQTMHMSKGSLTFNEKKQMTGDQMQKRVTFACEKN